MEILHFAQVDMFNIEGFDSLIQAASLRMT
jgi:hypothetical protein